MSVGLVCFPLQGVKWSTARSEFTVLVASPSKSGRDCREVLKDAVRRNSFVSSCRVSRLSLCFDLLEFDQTLSTRKMFHHSNEAPLTFGSVLSGSQLVFIFSRRGCYGWLPPEYCSTVGRNDAPH